jgi:hypothetical protein
MSFYNEMHELLPKVRNPHSAQDDCLGMGGLCGCVSACLWL